MTNKTTIQQSLTSKLSELRENTTVIENSSLLDFAKMKHGVLVFYATWSSQAIINCTQAIQTLYEQNYNGHIIVIDIDCMTPDFQIKTFGQISQGWGEIFTVRKGKIRQKYLGKDSFANFKTDVDKLLKF